MLTGRRCGGTSAMSAPSMRIHPASGVSNPASMRRSVVLPHPEGPSRAKNSPRPISTETSSTATVAPKRLVTPRTATIGSPFIGAGSAPGFDARPGAGALALVALRRRLVEEEPGAHPLGRVDVRVLAQLVVDHVGGERIGVGVAHLVADRRD